MRHFTLSEISLLAGITLSELVSLRKLFPLERIMLSELVSLRELFPLGGIALRSQCQ